MAGQIVDRECIYKDRFIMVLSPAEENFRHGRCVKLGIGQTGG